MVVSLAAMGVMSIQATRTGFGDTVTSSMLVWIALVVAVNVLAAALALAVGIRHFNRLET